MDKGRPAAFFPKVDGTPIRVQSPLAALPQRPKVIGPIFDVHQATLPIAAFDQTAFGAAFGEQQPGGTLSPVPPPQPEAFADPYLYPTLTRHERLRLTMLWYHTRDITEDKELLQRLQEKVDLAREFVGWDFGLCGLVDSDVYTRIVTTGLPLVTLPRRESTCSHTINQTPGTVFEIPDMAKDWRFQRSAPVVRDGLRSYAGTNLRCKINDDEEIAMGSLCVASNTPGLTLSPSQQAALVRFADMVTSEIVNWSRLCRRRQQQRMGELIAKAHLVPQGALTEQYVLDIAHEIYPSSHISIQDVHYHCIVLQGRPALSLTHVHSGLWEDAEYIDSVLLSSNQAKLMSEHSVRAVVGRVWTQTTARALVVESKEVQLIFDDVDSWFIERCSSLLATIMQERLLKEALSAKEHFLRGITHQLRTPIHGVLGSVDLLAEELAERKLLHAANGDSSRPRAGKTSTAEILRTIRNSGRELMSTVNGVIKLNRWAEVSGAPRRVAFSVLNDLEVDMLNDAVQMIPDEETKGISIYFDNQLTIESSIIMIDVVLLKECLQSLVLNALHFTTHGNVIITISAAEDFSFIRFDIEDTGCGIAGNDMVRIFESYEKASVHSRGAGLGLTLADKIARAMNGQVTLVSSAPGQGSHFRAEFRDPGFACPFGRERKPVAPFWWLPKTYKILRSDPPSRLVAHLETYLSSRGLVQDPNAQVPLLVVSFTPNKEQFKRLLATVAPDQLAMCLIPEEENTEALRKANPTVIFFSGPFLTRRLNKIMEEVDQAYAPSNVECASPRPFSSLESPVPLGAALTAAMKEFPLREKKKKKACPKLYALLVDDNLINLRIMRMYCEKRAIPYAQAMDGLEAIEQFKLASRMQAVSLVLLDLQMPKCDGVRACAEIRAYEEEMMMPASVIFIVTGQDSPDDRMRSIEAGANEFYVKPMSIKTLDRGIAQYFGAGG